MPNGSKNRCVIVAAAPEIQWPEIAPSDFVIACDAGYNHAKAANAVPDIIIGDFDSCALDLPAEIKTIRVNAEKDDTDTMLAVKYGLQHGFTDFLLLGALGGRLDHQLANISAAAYIAESGGRCQIYDKTCELHAFRNGELVIRNKKGAIASVFAYTDHAYGVSLDGMKYILKDAALKNTFPLGVSNEITADVAKVAVASGILLVVLENCKG